jgi:hypothetical protein
VNSNGATLDHLAGLYAGEIEKALGAGESELLERQHDAAQRLGDSSRKARLAAFSRRKS